MRFPLLFACLSLGVVTGCAGTMGGGQERVVVAVDAPPQRSSEVVEVTEVVAPIAPDAAQTRPRLAQTVTLGQTTDAAAYSAAPAQQATGTTGPNVVVNNNITVVGSPGVYGGYGGYGYGGYAGGYGAGNVTHRSTGGSRGAGYAPSGWEGAGRTAAPGQTPHVGGNWAPAPSHGPRAMK